MRLFFPHSSKSEALRIRKDVAKKIEEIDALVQVQTWHTLSPYASSINFVESYEIAIRQVDCKLIFLKSLCQP